MRSIVRTNFMPNIQCILAIVRTLWCWEIVFACSMLCCCSNDQRCFHATGVGISLPGHVFLGSLQNNSVVVVDSQEQNRTQEVFCHSALKSSCPGQWLDRPEATPEVCSESGSRAMAFNSVKLDLTSVVEGLLVCVTEDRNREVQRLYLGVYLSGTYNIILLLVLINILSYNA